MPLFDPSGKFPLPDAPLVGAPKLTEFSALNPQELAALALQATAALSGGHHPANTGVQISLDNLCRLLMSCEPIESRIKRAIDAHPATPLDGTGPTMTAIRWIPARVAGMGDTLTVTHSRYDVATGRRSAIRGQGTSVDEALADLTFQEGTLSDLLRIREE